MSLELSRPAGRRLVPFVLALVIMGVNLVVSPSVSAQDMRTVTEPVIPPVCQTLAANLAVKRGKLVKMDEGKLDTQRLQAALDQCAPGQAVELRGSGTNAAFLSGPLTISRGVTLLVDRGVTLFASRNPRDFDARPGACGTVDHKGNGCRPLLSIKAPNAAVMGDGVIDGRGGEDLLGHHVTWWDLAAQARSGGKQNCFRLIVASHADNFILYRITLRNSPNFHVVVDRTDGFTAWGVKIDTPATARNTDGIDPSGSKNITITHSWIRDGDDDVAIKAGGSGPSTDISIAHDHFYYGHGMSIGSETFSGDRRILVQDLSLDGTTSGIRIKSDSSRGGLVDGVTYRDVCMRNVKTPIDIDPFYEHQRGHGDKIPVFRDIFLEGVHAMTPGKVIMDGFDSTHGSAIWLNGVEIDGVLPHDVETQFGAFTVGPGVVNFTMQGAGVTVSKGNSGVAAVPDCKNRFPGFPRG